MSHIYIYIYWKCMTKLVFPVTAYTWEKQESYKFTTLSKQLIRLKE